MRKIESLTNKRWNKMWKLWKRKKLDTPLDELVTYYNAMCHGHLFYFKQFKGNSLEIIRQMWILKQYISKEHYNNLIEAYELKCGDVSIVNEIDKLGNLEDVKISLYEVSTGERHYLDPSEENIQDKALAMLDTIEYKLYSKNKLVEPAWLGEYTITLEGDITIHINATCIIVDGNNRVIKEYTNDTLFKVIDLLISSESIEVTDEDFNQ